MTAGRITILAGIAVLLAGVVLFLVGLRPPPPPAFHGSVKDLLPNIEEMPGWKVEYLPIADTPEMQAKVNQELNYDDAVFAVYTRGVTRVSIYLAYWRPGKMSQRLIASHTPDVCWPAAGWKLIQAESRSNLNVDGVFIAPECEKRVMAFNNTTEYVMFWHRAGGELIKYNALGLPPWYATFSDIFKRGLNQKEEQFFVRISSNQVYASWPSQLSKVHRRIVELTSK